MDIEDRYEYESRQKSTVLAYLLWLIGFGLHHFYLGNLVQAIVQLILAILMTVAFLRIPWEELAAGAQTDSDVNYSALGTLVIISLIWRLVDLFKIPGYVKAHKLKVLNEIADDQ